MMYAESKVDWLVHEGIMCCASAQCVLLLHDVFLLLQGFPDYFALVGLGKGEERGPQGDTKPKGNPKQAPKTARHVTLLDR